jgi:hypothetical protein
MPIYFLHSIEASLVKIGWCSSPDKMKTRAWSERHQTGATVALIGSRDGSLEDERALHMRHAADWRVSEWFEATDALMADARGEWRPGPDHVDAEEVREWLRSWRTPWTQICALSGVGLGPLAEMADSGRIPRIPTSIALHRAFLVIERRRTGLALPIVHYASKRGRAGREISGEAAWDGAALLPWGTPDVFVPASNGRAA